MRGKERKEAESRKKKKEKKKKEEKDRKEGEEKKDRRDRDRGQEGMLLPFFARIQVQKEKKKHLTLEFINDLKFLHSREEKESKKERIARNLLRVHFTLSLSFSLSFLSFFFLLYLFLSLSFFYLSFRKSSIHCEI